MIEMINRGWILRNTIIWHKSNCMPSSVKDRFTVDFEYIYFFVKIKKYYFEQQLEEQKDSSIKRYEYPMKGCFTPGVAYPNEKRDRPQTFKLNNEGRNKRCVWTINPKPYTESHYAVYSPELLETPIKAGCPEGGTVLDPFVGSGTTMMVAEELKRNSIGIDLDPKSIELVKGWDRLGKYIGQTTLDGKITTLEVLEE